MAMRVRLAVRDDLAQLIRLLADDALGAVREDPDGGDSEYGDAFDAIASDDRNFLLVGDDEGAVVACVQVTLTPGLTHRGAVRATLEGVRVRSDRRGESIGEALLREAVEFARERGARIVQLTTDKRRPDAKRFYERLGFEATHEGMKLRLT